MKRSEVRALIKSAVDELNQSISFNNGLLTRFTAESNKKYPYVWLEPLSVSTDLNTNQMPIDSWSCLLHIAKQDKMDSIPSQYEPLIDECDEIAQKFIYKLNQVVTGYKLITLISITREPFTKRHTADPTSGVTVEFTLQVADQTDVC